MAFSLIAKGCCAGRETPGPATTGLKVNNWTTFMIAITYTYYIPECLHLESFWLALFFFSSKTLRPKQLGWLAAAAELNDFDTMGAMHLGITARSF